MLDGYWAISVSNSDLTLAYDNTYSPVGPGRSSDGYFMEAKKINLSEVIGLGSYVIQQSPEISYAYGTSWIDKPYDSSSDLTAQAVLGQDGEGYAHTLALTHTGAASPFVNGVGNDGSSEGEAAQGDGAAEGGSGAQDAAPEAPGEAARAAAPGTGDSIAAKATAAIPATADPTSVAALAASAAAGTAALLGGIAQRLRRR